jgi:UDP-glucose 4-epimerase
MQNNSVVVTGGAGFIGTNIVERLLQERYRVTIIDDLSTGRLENIQPLLDDENLTFIECSIMDEDRLTEIFKDHQYVIHQAALPSMQRSVENPIDTNKVNVSGTLRVLNSAKEASIQKVVMASSSSVYGDTPTLPKIETMVPNPKSPYAVTKLTGEQYCRIFTELYDLKTVCLRYFNVFGPHQNPKSDYAAVIPKFIHSILNDRPLTIFGDGTQTRDFTYVQNVVDANILAMNSDATGIFNIACGERISLIDLANTLMSLANKNVDIIYTDPRIGDIEHSHADITLAKEKIGYEPVLSAHHGLMETLKWFMESEKTSSRDPEIPILESDCLEDPLA